MAVQCACGSGPAKDCNKHACKCGVWTAEQDGVRMCCLLNERDGLAETLAAELRTSTELAIRLDLMRKELAAAKHDCSGLRRAWLSLCEEVGEWGRGAPDATSAALRVIDVVRKMKDERDQLRKATR